MLCRVSTARVVSRRQKKSPLLPCSACAPSETIAVPFCGRTLHLLLRCALAWSSETRWRCRARRAQSAARRRWHARWRTGSQVLLIYNGSWSVRWSDGSVFSGCGGVETGLIQQRRCVSVHGRSGAPRLNWCSPGWYWLSCTGRQVQHRAWRGWSALVVWQRSARERIRIATRTFQRQATVRSWRQLAHCRFVARGLPQGPLAALHSGRLRSGWVCPPDVQGEARTSSWSVASVGPPAASGLSLGRGVCCSVSGYQRSPSASELGAL